MKPKFSGPIPTFERELAAGGTQMLIRSARDGLRRLSFPVAELVCGISKKEALVDFRSGLRLRGIAS
jgi:hypothetical protein